MLKHITQLISSALLCSMVVSIAARAADEKPAMKMKYKGGLTASNDLLTVIIEHSVYTMFEEAKGSVDREAIQDPIDEIVKDLNYWYKSELPSDPAMAKKWGLKDTSAKEWMKWFGQRVHVITGADETKEEFWTSRFDADKNFPVNFTYKKVTQKAVKPTDIIAKNLSFDIFRRTSDKGSALRYKNSDYPALAKDSHFGLVKIFPSFFSEGIITLESPENSEEEVYSNTARIFRVASMLHEARHGDGKGDNIGFAHSTCPKDHPYAGTKTCDRSQNGPYSVSQNFVKLYIEACRKNTSANGICSDKEINFIEALAMADESKVLIPNEYKFDGDGEKVVQTLDSSTFDIFQLTQSAQN